MNFVNLTPRTINIVNDNGEIIRAFPPSGQVARCAITQVPAGFADGIALIETTLGAVSGLPELRTDTIYIVSALVRQAIPDRAGIASPNDMVYDAAGNIVGCKNLAVN